MIGAGYVVAFPYSARKGLSVEATNNNSSTNYRDSFSR